MANSNIIYKMRLLSASDKSTPYHIANYVEYITEREHALRDNNGFVLFGKMKDETQMQSKNTVKKYLSKIAHKSSIYNTYISFRPEIAEMLNLGTDIADWQLYIKYHIDKMMRAYDIPYNRFEYVAAVHLKFGQPHIHLTFWDRNPPVIVNYINSKVSDNVRKQIIKDSFTKELSTYYNASNQDLAEIVKQVDNLLDAQKDYKLSHNYFKLYNYIYDNLPQKGRLVYAYLSPQLKNQMIKLIREMFQAEELKPILCDYYQNELKALLIFNSNDTEYGKKIISEKLQNLEDKFYNRIGNIILKAMKRAKITAKEKEVSQMQSLSVMADIAKCIIRLLDSKKSNISNHQLNAITDLSKQSRKDMHYLNQDKGKEN